MSRTLARIPLVLLSVVCLPATASAANCPEDQTSRVHVFQRDGVYRACLRGYPSHRLGPDRPQRRRVKGTMLAYTTHARGHDRIAALDLADGDRWLRPRPAGGHVVRMKLRRVGALLWTTDRGAVFVATFDRPAQRVDRLSAPATGLRITKRQTEGDICGALYEYTFHWRAYGAPRSVSWEAFEGAGCG